MKLVEDAKPLVLPNITMNGTVVEAGGCFESNYSTNASTTWWFVNGTGMRSYGPKADVQNGRHVVVYDANASQCFGEWLVHYAGPAGGYQASDFLPMNAENGP